MATVQEVLDKARLAVANHAKAVQGAKDAAKVAQQEVSSAAAQ